MMLKDIGLAPWFYPKDSPTKYFIVKVLLGEEKVKLKTKPKFEIRDIAGMPSGMKSFIKTHGAVLMAALIEGKDIPFFGHGSDWPWSAHKDFLENILAGMSAQDLCDKHIHGDDDIDYFQYSYGADGDSYDIEDEYNDKTLSDDFLELDSDLYTDIKFGLVSMEWYIAAKKLGLTNWEKKH